ncbi:MAG: (d)CMP kinase [Tenacibaculum sp.]|nr:(d)CMP kinase [Tenacibaculum sp.]
MKKKITIAIDGFSSTGKSTIAKKLAKKLNYIHIDTGAMYRAITLYAMNKEYIKKDFFDKEKLITDLPNINISFKFNKEKNSNDTYLNGENVEDKIRSITLSNFVSHVASIPEVRKKLVKIQREIAKNKGVVMDGRDIGTVVLPNADLKLFLTASADKRATRRYKELISKGEKVSFDEVLKNVQDRDFFDSNRSDSPLTEAEDAINIDNSDMGLEEQFEHIMGLINNL